MKVLSIIILVLLLLTGGYLGYVYFFRYEKPVQAKRTLSEEIYIERNDRGHYIIHFNKQDTYDIFSADSVENIDWEGPFMTTSDSLVILTDFDFSDRYFFGFENSKGERIVASERQIRMEGADNFRDLGGIPTADGRVIKWGKFYRSGKLNQLTPRDLDYFATLGIETVVDFRDNVERAKDPSRFPESYKVRNIQVAIGDTTGALQDELKEKIFNADPDTWDGVEFISQVNRDFIDSFAFQYQPFLDIATDPSNTPVLYHCSAGKDRTGLGTALLLSVLGVEREIIMSDFLLSNYYKYESIKQKIWKGALAGLDPVITKPIATVDESYLAAAFEAIENNYGSIDSMLRIEYGFSAEDLEYIRDTFLLSPGYGKQIVSETDTLLIEKDSTYQ